MWQHVPPWGISEGVPSRQSRGRELHRREACRRFRESGPCSSEHRTTTIRRPSVRPHWDINLSLRINSQSKGPKSSLRHAQSLSLSLRRNENFYIIKFRPRQTRRQFYDLPKKGVGRVRYQVNAELEGFRKGDIVRVKGKWVKQINSIYSNGYLAFARLPCEPNCAKPKDCQLLQRGQTVIWEKAV